MPTSAPLIDEQTNTQAPPITPWVTVVWNDPVNLMSYVTYVFMKHFGYPQPQAERLMMTVHQAGRANVAHGTREQMETDVQAMQGYGLWSTLERA
ncbi:MAG: ATP-dependent Clp protease adapter ClpS [Propionibacteriaceae bacterium]|nr:ATP-dependent Clp protease adapter ClpS [Propionibacteriaceae bacterium]